MVKKNSMPSYVALPITAALIYAIKLFYFGNDAMLLNATAASGLVSTLTPITVIFGAIMFNRMMEPPAVSTSSANGWLPSARIRLPS